MMNSSSQSEVGYVVGLDGGIVGQHARYAQLFPDLMFGGGVTPSFDDTDDDPFDDYDNVTSEGNDSVTSSWRMRQATVGSRERMLRALGRNGQVRIPLYAIILVMAVVGNVLVMVTLAQNRAMRTVTNLFLLNLSVSDLLLAVLCMPFTLIPTLLQDFVFGAAMCVLIRYMQGQSVRINVADPIVCRPHCSINILYRKSMIVI